MGWKGDGYGLGKDGQGILKPVDIDMSMNRFGFGFVYTHDGYDDELRELEQIDSISKLDLNDPRNSPPNTNNTHSRTNSNIISKNSNNFYNRQQAQKQKGIGMRELLNNIHRLLANFIGAQSQNDLVFDKSLTIEERKFVHREAHKLGLKTRSEGSGENRFLVVSKKRSTNEIIESTMTGAQISKYKMISKGNMN
jgi:hypothetical protein